MAATQTFVLPQQPNGMSSRAQIDTNSVLTSTDRTNKFLIAPYTQATLYFVTTASSGTSPTLNIRVQKLLPDNTTWQDIASIAQVTGNASKVLHLVSGGNLQEAQQSEALAAGTVNAVPFGAWWRISYVVGGTNPSFTMNSYIEALS